MIILKGLICEDCIRTVLQYVAIIAIINACKRYMDLMTENTIICMFKGML